MDRLGIKPMWEERILQAMDSKGLEPRLTSCVSRPNGDVK